MDFHAALRALVIEPLGIEAWLGEEPPHPVGYTGGTLGDHVGTPLEPYNSPWYRALGFPWAGMVATAPAALAIVRAFAGQFDGFLPPDLCAEATRDQAQGLGGGYTFWRGMAWDSCPWGLGVELHGQKAPHYMPPAASPATFGHLGQTGVCVAWDPVAGVGWALLGTRTMEPWWHRMADIGAALLAA
jgi:CubicO group peptidase (beta-lactamase class C family)